MAKKIFMMEVVLSDMVMANSEKEARKLYRKEHSSELQGIDDSKITCKEYDKVMEEIKKERDQGASSSVCEEVMAQDMRHVGWTEADDNGETD